MFDDKDLGQLASKGVSVESIQNQLAYFEKGFPWIDIIAPASAERGIRILSEKELEEAMSYYDNAQIRGKCKFVPASGAATRMFKDLYAGMEALKAGQTLADDSPAAVFVSRIDKFAFYNPELFVSKSESETDREYQLRILEQVLTDFGGNGLNYGKMPKGQPPAY